MEAIFGNDLCNGAGSMQLFHLYARQGGLCFLARAPFARLRGTRLPLATEIDFHSRAKTKMQANIQNEKDKEKVKEVNGQNVY